ncbi:unnamed protein product [Linum trigynum]|uniref:Uncharacterized protein n=1 Tax=Linum trigynum TaxID=586398 RepID=A0AAV2CYQ1_9ROSI
MGPMSILGHGASIKPPKFTPGPFRYRRDSKLHSSSPRVGFPILQETHTSIAVTLPFRQSTLRIRSLPLDDAGNFEAYKDHDGENGGTSEILENQRNESTDTENTFLLILVAALGVAVILTIVSAGLREPSVGSFFGVQCLSESSKTTLTAVPVGYSFKAFGYRIILPEYAPGWLYFWLLMAAGFGLFISEEALNIWVGISLSRMLSLDGTWQSFAASFSKNSAYITSTVLWVYWGVCISDMVPFYLGKLFNNTGASNDIRAKIGISEEKFLSITGIVQKYGNLAGFVERFSLGVRNPTAFLAGSLGVSPECFFAGVCCGGVVTLSVQLGIGFLLRERPMFALATVATVVGIWTVFPYAMAASTALFLYLQRRHTT